MFHDIEDFTAKFKCRSNPISGIYLALLYAIVDDMGYTAIPQDMMTVGPFNQGTFHYLAPINLSLALFILGQNSFVITHLYKERARYPSLLFLLIAVCTVV